uniref:Metalloendopeptidase n=1 Tax=Sarcophilus harrisii TaxID=9305 RepID=A0A7N4PE70_SARHA
MKRALDLWPLVLGLLTLVGALGPTKPPDDNATSFMTHVTPEGTQSTWDGDIPAINQGLIPEESPESSFLVEGDIIKRPFQLFSAASFKWPKKDGIVKIPYLFSSKYDQPSREVILEAFADFEHFTCVRFVPRTNQKDFVSIIPMSGCFSSVGHSGGMQVASLAPFCLQKGKGIALHELMHVLGFWHEHSRADRDRYIHISWKEIRPGFEINFIKSQNSNMLVPYDYTSVMHYGRYAFSKSGNTTILPLAGPDIPIGQRWNLSTSDIIRINRLYECSQTVKDSGLHGENNGSHRKLGVVEFIDQKEKKLRPTEAPFKALPSLQAVSQAGEGNRASPGWPISAPSEHPQGREMANTTWSISPSSPGAAWTPEIVSPSEAVASETVKNRPVSLHNPETALLVSEPSTSAPLLTLLSRGTMASFPEPTSLPEIHNSILAVGQRGGLPGTPLLGRGDWSEGMAPLVSFSSGLQSPSPDWWARPKSTPASTRTSHPSLGSGPGPHRCQLCPQEETDSAPTAGGRALASRSRGFLWRLLKALTMASASRNLSPLRGARAQGLGAGDQLFSAELRRDTALSEPPGVVFPTHGTHNPQAAEEPAQTLIEGERREADFGEEEKLKQIAFGVATGVPDGARQKLSLSMGQGSTWSRWGPKHGSSEKDVLKQPRRDSFSGDHVGAHLSQAKSLSSSHNLSWASSMALTPREGIPVLRRGNGDFMVPGAVSGNPIIPSLGVASNSTREEFGSGPSTLFPEKKAPTSSQDGELHSLQIQASQSEVGLPNTLPAANSQTPSSTPVAPALFLKPLTNKIPAQMESLVLAAFIQTPHLSHLMENVTRNRFIFPVSQRNPPYLGMETPDEAFQRSGGAHSKVRTTAVDGKEEKQIGSLFTVGSAFPEGEVASPAVSVNSVLSLEDSGNQKPHPSGRIIQGSLGVTEKNQILSSAPLRCLPGGIQLFLGGSMIPLLPMEPERIPRGYKSKETLKFLSLGVGRKVASFLSWISNSSSVTLGHLVPLPRSLEDPRSQTFLLAETKPGMLRPERAADPKLAGPGIVLLKSPLGLLSLVPLWECWDPSGVRKLAYFSEPEALEKEYSPASDESSSSATEAVVLPLQTLKTQIPFLDRPQEKKGRDQFGITPLPLIQTTVKMTHLVRNKVIQMLREEHETSKEQGGRDPKFLPFRSSFGEALPLRNPSLGLDASFQRHPLLALGTQTSNWAEGTLPPLASSAVGSEPWPQEGGAAWTRVLPGEPMVKEGRLKFQAYHKLLSLIGPGMEPQLTDVPSAREAHNEKAREEGKTPSPSPSRAGHGNKPSTDYFNPRETLSVSLLDHKAWMAQHRVQSRPTDDEHISQMLPYGSLPAVRRETVPTTFKTEREAEELRNVVGKSKSLAESSAVHSERAKSSSSQLHLVNLSSPLDQPIKSTKTKSKVPSSQGRKGGLVSFSSMGITLPLDKTSYFRMTILPSFSSSPSSSPSLSPSSSPSLSPSSSPSLSPSSSPSLSPSSSPSLSPSSSPSLSPSSSPSLSPSSSPSLSPSSSPSLSPSSSPSLSPSSSPSLSPSSSPSLSPPSSPSLSPSSSPSLSPSSFPSFPL